MLVHGVEGERNATCMVKDSKAYIEIAKFVQAYTTIIQNPNAFLSEVGEEGIDPQTDLLSWEQMVKIMTQCDLGFEPVPNEKQLVAYYSYAKQIGAISKETKSLATVSDVAEAQKHYYNFIDEETEKANAIYSKQHEIALSREKEVGQIEANLKNIKLKNSIYFACMMLSVFLVGFGFASIFFDNAVARVFGFSNHYVGGVVMMILGLVAFFFMDRLYIKTKENYFNYKKNTRSTVSRSERTSRDEKILRDKLAKYEEDLKIAKYELADKDKRFDVEKNIERLRERNKYYRMLRDRDGINQEGGSKHKHSLLDELEQTSLFGGDGLFSMFGADRKAARRRKANGMSQEESENLFAVGKDGIIDEKGRGRRGESGNGKPKGTIFGDLAKGLNEVYNKMQNNVFKPVEKMGKEVIEKMGELVSPSSKNSKPTANEYNFPKPQQTNENQTPKAPSNNTQISSSNSQISTSMDEIDKINKTIYMCDKIPSGTTLGVLYNSAKKEQADEQIIISQNLKDKSVNELFNDMQLFNATQSSANTNANVNTNAQSALQRTQQEQRNTNNILSEKEIQEQKRILDQMGGPAQG